LNDAFRTIFHSADNFIPKNLKMIIFNSEYLKEYTIQVFVKMGCPIEQAKIAADCLNQADLRGVDSHGVARLSGYVRLWELNYSPDTKHCSIRRRFGSGFGYGTTRHANCH
jgi:LDH2 family malate/lactate/ureidoglycolate dehydrogenase